MNLKQTFLSKIYKTDTCWFWNGYTSKKGYGRFYFHKQYIAHRVSYELFKGPIPNGLLVCHKCDIRNCVNPDHLFLGTNQDNMTDMVKKGRSNHLYGIKNHQVKLTEVQVLEIRAKYKAPSSKNKRNGYSIHKLAEEYNINCQTIYAIISKRIWKHL